MKTAAVLVVIAAEIHAKHGKVIIPGHEHDDELTPAEAREMSAQLMRASYLADSQQDAITKACTGGHQWGPGWNSNLGTAKQTGYSCTREGCTGRRYEPGWLPFEPKTHAVPIAGYWQPRECTGPGCEYCDNEAYGTRIREILREGAKTLDHSLFATPPTPSFADLSEYLKPLHEQDRRMRDLGYGDMHIELKEPAGFADDTVTLVATWKPSTPIRHEGDQP